MPPPLPPPAGSRSIASFFRSPPAGSAARAASATSAALRASPAIAEASETDRSEGRGAEAGGPDPGPDPVAPDEPPSPSPETRGALSENNTRAVLPWRVAPESARGRPLVAYRRKRRATHPPESAQHPPPPPARVAPPAPAPAPAPASAPAPAPAEPRPPAAPPPRKDKRPTKQLFLDLGQKSFGHVVCAVCGLLYARGEPRDEKTHDAFHAERARDDLARGGAGIDDDDRRPATTANAGHHRAPARTIPGARFETPHHRAGGAALTCAEGWGAEATAWRGGEKVHEKDEKGEKRGDDSGKTREPVPTTSGTTHRVVFARGSTRAAAASGGAHPRVPTSGATSTKSSSLWRKMREVARVVEGELGAAPGWILGGEDERKTPKNEGEAAEGFDFEGTLTSSRGGGGDVRGEGKNTPLGPTLSRRDVRGFAYVIEGEKTKNPSSSRRGGGGKGGGKGGKGGKGGRIVGALFAEPLSRARWTRRGGGGSDDAGCVRVASEDTADGWARATIGVRAAWTHPAHRRSGVARTLLEVALRETVAGGYVCDRGECAFSQPTVDGARFAARTCGRADGAFLVYDE